MTVRKTFIAHKAAIAILISFFAIVVVTAFVINHRHPAIAISGESSIGTWLSGVLLVMAAILSLVLGMQKGLYPWIVFFAFFILLALDERFMFHEQLKERLIFRFNTLPNIIYEVPVLGGALLGAFMAVRLWKSVNRDNRIFLYFSIIAGCVSVTMDVLRLGALPEDGFKLLAELCLVCTLTKEVNV